MDHQEINEIEEVSEEQSVTSEEQKVKVPYNNSQLRG
jgi:hypothetical protein